jgi:hypothetical protein
MTDTAAPTTKGTPMGPDRLAVFTTPEPEPDPDTSSTDPGKVRPLRGKPPKLAPEVTADYRSRLLTGPEVLTLPPTRWLIRRWIPDRSVGVVFGKPGAGKSFVALALALEMARGGRWFGEALDPGTVLYVAGERAEVIRDRMEAWTLHTGEPIPTRFVMLPARPQVLAPDHLEALCAIVAELRPRLVVLDTLATMTVGVEENSGKEWGSVADALTAVKDAADGGSVVAVHHAGKDTTKGMRGHTVLLGAVDYTLEVVGDAQAIRVGVEKLNASAKPLPEWYRVEPVTLPALPGDDLARDGGVLVSTTGKNAGEARGADLLRVLVELYADSGMSQKDAREALEVSPATAKRALAALVERGWVVSSGKGAQVRYYPTDAGREVLADPDDQGSGEPF